MQACLAKDIIDPCLSLEIDISGGLIERGLISNSGSERRGLLARRAKYRFYSTGAHRMDFRIETCSAIFFGQQEKWLLI